MRPSLFDLTTGLPAPDHSGEARRLSVLPEIEVLDAAARSTLDDPTETALFATLVQLAVRGMGARSVLDVGCGTGLPTLAAVRAGATRVVGIDLARCNVDEARKNAARAGLAHCVEIRHANWNDVAGGRVTLGAFDLLVANPPYVPGGDAVVVDGGPTGTRLLESIVRGAPDGLRGMALLFSSLNPPRLVFDALARRGFEVGEVLVQSVPFGRYTSQPATLARLRTLREQRRAWFCDVAAPRGLAPHAYLTLGVVARRVPAPEHGQALASLERLLEEYRRGPLRVPEGPWLLGATAAA